MSLGKVDIIVCGAGAIGSAIARFASGLGKEVMVIERERSAGCGTSSRNSGVIHAGLYYPKGSKKHVMCISGRRMLLDYLKEKNLPHSICGKLVVSTHEQQSKRLADIFEQSKENGVEGVTMLERNEVEKLEPNVFCHRAIFSPFTGIFDVASFIEQLESDAKSNGADFIYNCQLNHATKVRESRGEEFLVSTSQGDIYSRVLINAAGLHAPTVARKIKVKELPEASISVPKMYFSKGNYFKLSGKSPFARLVYPIPSHGGLGIHATLDMQGMTRFGPDSQWLQPDKKIFGECSNFSTADVQELSDNFEFLFAPDFSQIEGYRVDESLLNNFYEAIKTYYPEIAIRNLSPDYAGIRPKLIGPNYQKVQGANGRNLEDFLIEGSSTHGIEGLVNLFGIESPGLTSSLAIAKHVVCDILQLGSDR